MRITLIALLVIIVAVTAVVEYPDFNNVKWLDCYDGDTCNFDIARVPDIFGNDIPVRIFGIDTPEIKGKCDAEKAKAVKAKDFVVGLLSKAKTVQLVKPQREKYFRVLATVLADGVDVGKELIKKKLAVPYFGDTKETDWCATTTKSDEENISITPPAVFTTEENEAESDDDEPVDFVPPAVFKREENNVESDDEPAYFVPPAVFTREQNEAESDDEPVEFVPPAVFTREQNEVESDEENIALEAPGVFTTEEYDVESDGKYTTLVAPAVLITETEDDELLIDGPIYPVEDEYEDDDEPAYFVPSAVFRREENDVESDGPIYPEEEELSETFNPERGSFKFEYATTNSHGSSVGARSLQALIKRLAPAGYSGGIYNYRPVKGTKTLSLHSEGRALDWMLNVKNAGQAAQGNAVVDYFLSNGAANAKKYGIQELIWNRKIWTALKPGSGMRAYRGDSPHEDHIHIGMNRWGASQQF
jgi:micrococcal nuclease